MIETKKRKWLTELRRTKGWTQTELAFYANISAPHIQAIELGVRRPTVSVAQRIAKLLDFDWTLFYPYEDDTTENKAHTV